MTTKNGNTRGSSAKDEMKDEIRDTLTDLVGKFYREAKQQKKLFRELKQSFEKNANFASEENVENWNRKEVCYWLITNRLERYALRFYSKKVTGQMLLSDMAEEMVLVHDLKIPSKDSKKIVKLIQELKERAESKLQEDEFKFDTNMTKETMQLANRINDDPSNMLTSKNLDTRTSITITKVSDLREKIISMKRIITAQINPSHNIDSKHINVLRNEIKKRNEIIKILKETVSTYESTQETEIDLYKHRSSELEHGYVKLENYYTDKLTRTRSQSVVLQTRMQSMNAVLQKNTSLKQNYNVLLNENNRLIQINNDLQNEVLRFKLLLNSEFKNKELLKASLKEYKFEISQEIHKRKLLENQTQRLTQQLTSFLMPEADVSMEPMNADVVEDSYVDGYSISRNSSSHLNLISTTPLSQLSPLTPLSTTEAGWFKFLSSNNANPNKKESRFKKFRRSKPKKNFPQTNSAKPPAAAAAPVKKKKQRRFTFSSFTSRRSSKTRARSATKEATAAVDGRIDENTELDTSKDVVVEKTNPSVEKTTDSVDQKVETDAPKNETAVKKKEVEKADNSDSESATRGRTRSRGQSGQSRGDSHSHSRGRSSSGSKNYTSYLGGVRRRLSNIKIWKENPANAVADVSAGASNDEDADEIIDVNAYENQNVQVEELVQTIKEENAGADDSDELNNTGPSNVTAL